MNGFEVEAHAAFDRRLNPGSTVPVALGLSGGGDSLALLLIAADWARAHRRRLLALTVDHRLHPDSGRWTALAGEAARRASVDWAPLAWTGPKPATGLPEAARLARHRLLAEAARAAGARVILLGHTADDAAEGDQMRETEAPGLGRLREWTPSPVWPEGREVFLLRPLLRARRPELRDWLTARGETWLDDPANEDAKYARVRARRALLQPSPLAGEGGARPPAGRERGCTALAAKTCVTPHPPIAGDGPLPLPQGERAFTPDGRIVLPRGALTPHALAASLLCVGGGETPPRGPRLERLLGQLQDGERVTATLAGARVMAARESVEMAREAGERARGGLAEIALQPGESAIWDGRYEITAEVVLTVGPLAGRMGRLPPAERAALKALPAHARSALPVLEWGGRVALPRPFGAGPASVRELVSARFAAATGQVSREP